MPPQYLTGFGEEPSFGSAGIALWILDFGTSSSSAAALRLGSALPLGSVLVVGSAFGSFLAFAGSFFALAGTHFFIDVLVGAADSLLRVASFVPCSPAASEQAGRLHAAPFF